MWPLRKSHHGHSTFWNIAHRVFTAKSTRVQGLIWRQVAVPVLERLLVSISPVLQKSLGLHHLDSILD